MDIGKLWSDIIDHNVYLQSQKYTKKIVPMSCRLLQFGWITARRSWNVENDWVSFIYRPGMC